MTWYLRHVYDDSFAVAACQNNIKLYHLNHFKTIFMFHRMKHFNSTKKIIYLFPGFHIWQLLRQQFSILKKETVVTDRWIIWGLSYSHLEFKLFSFLPCFPFFSSHKNILSILHSITCSVIHYYRGFTMSISKTNSLSANNGRNKWQR